MNEMSEKAISVLHMICNNSPMTKSDLGRRTTTHIDLFSDERNDILTQLIDLGHVEEKKQAYMIGQRPPTYYLITDKGRMTRDQIIKDQQSLVTS